MVFTGRASPGRSDKHKIPPVTVNAAHLLVRIAREGCPIGRREVSLPSGHIDSKDAQLLSKCQRGNSPDCQSQSCNFPTPTHHIEAHSAIVTTFADKPM